MLVVEHDRFVDKDDVYDSIFEAGWSRSSSPGSNRARMGVILCGISVKFGETSHAKMSGNTEPSPTLSRTQRK